jgi:hypothetical protein
MCFGCCVSKICGVVHQDDISDDEHIQKLIDNEEDEQQSDRENLEHWCVHHGKIKALEFLLKNRRRRAYRRGQHHSEYFYYNLFRGLCAAITRNQFPSNVLKLFIERIKSDITYPQPIIIEKIGIIRSVDTFEDDLRTILCDFLRNRHSTVEIVEIPFLGSITMSQYSGSRKIHRQLIQISTKILRKMKKWPLRIRQKFINKELTFHVCKDLSNLITA